MPTHTHAHTHTHTHTHTGGSDSFGSTLHWGPGWTDDPYQLTHTQFKASVDLAADYHIYGLIWNETHIGNSALNIDLSRNAQTNLSLELL